MSNLENQRHKHNLDDNLTPLKRCVRKYALKERNEILQDDDFKEVLSPADKVFLHLAGLVPLERTLEYVPTPLRTLNPSSPLVSKRHHSNGVNPAATLLSSVINDPDIHNTSLNAIEELKRSSENASISTKNKRRVTSFNINTHENSEKEKTMAKDTNQKDIYTVLKEKRFESASAARRLQAFEAMRKAHEEEIASKEPKELPYEELLKGLNFYAEVRDGNENRSYSFKVKLREMGATVHNTLNKKVTHVVFRDGHLSTYKRAKEIGAHLVSVLWLEATQNAKYRVPEWKYPALGLEQYSSPITSKKFRRIKSMQPDYEGTREKNSLRNMKRKVTIETKKLLKNTPVKASPVKKTNGAKIDFLEILEKASENNPPPSTVQSEVTSSDDEFYLPPLVERLRENYIKIMSPTTVTDENGAKKNEVKPKLKNRRNRNIVLRETMSPIQTQDHVPFSQDSVTYSILDTSQGRENVEKGNRSLEANKSQTSITKFFQPSQNKEPVPEHKSSDSDSTCFSFNVNESNSTLEKSYENCKLNSENKDSSKCVSSDDNPVQNKSNACLNTLSKSDSPKEDSIHLRISTDDSASFSKNLGNAEDSLNIDAVIKALKNDSSGTLRAKLLEKLGVEDVNKSIEKSDSGLDKYNSSNEMIEILNNDPKNTEMVKIDVNKATNEIMYDSDFSYKIISSKDDEQVINNNATNENVRNSNEDPKNTEKIEIDVNEIMHDTDFSAKDNKKRIDSIELIKKNDATVQTTPSNNKIKNKASLRRKTMFCVKTYDDFDTISNKILLPEETSRRVTRQSFARGLQVPFENKKIDYLKDNSVADLYSEPDKNKKIECRRITKQPIAKECQTPSENQNDVRETVTNIAESTKQINTPGTSEAVSKKITTETPRSSIVFNTRSRRKTIFINSRTNDLEIESDITKNKGIDVDEYGIDTNKKTRRKTICKLGAEADSDNVNFEKSSKIRKSLFMTDSSETCVDDAKPKSPDNNKVVNLDKKTRRKTIFQLGTEADLNSVNSDRASKMRKSLFMTDSSETCVDDAKTKSPDNNKVVNLDKKTRRKTVFKLGTEADLNSVNTDRASKMRKSLFVTGSSKAPSDEVKTKSTDDNTVVNLDKKTRRKTVFKLGTEADSNSVNSDRASKMRKSLFVTGSSKTPSDEVKTKSTDDNKVVNLDKKSRRKTAFKFEPEMGSDNVNSEKASKTGESLFVANSSHSLNEIKTKSTESDDNNLKTHRKIVFKIDSAGGKKIIENDVSIDLTADSDADNNVEYDKQSPVNKKTEDEKKTAEREFNLEKNEKAVVSNKTPESKNSNAGLTTTGKKRKLFSFNSHLSDIEAGLDSFTEEPVKPAVCPYSPVKRKVKETKRAKKSKTNTSADEKGKCSLDKSKSSSSDEIPENEKLNDDVSVERLPENNTTEKDPSYHSDRRSTLLFLPKHSRKSLEILKKEEADNCPHKKSEKLPSIVCTRMHSGDVVLFEAIVKKLGGFVIENTVSSRTTHVVCGDMQRSLNMLRALARGCWLLKQEWLLKSMELQHWADEEAYEMVEFSPAVKKCRVERLSFGQPYTVNLLNDCGPIFISKNSKPGQSEMAELVKLCGGTITNTARAASIVIGEVTRNNDAVCVSERWLLDSLTKKKKLQFRKYNLER